MVKSHYKIRFVLENFFFYIIIKIYLFVKSIYPHYYYTFLCTIKKFYVIVVLFIYSKLRKIIQKVIIQVIQKVTISLYRDTCIY